MTLRKRKLGPHDSGTGPSVLLPNLPVVIPKPEVSHEFLTIIKIVLLPPPVSLTRFLMALTLGSNQSPNNYIWHILPIKTQKTSSNCTPQRIIMIAIILASEKICSHQEYYLLFIKQLTAFFLQNLDKVLYHEALGPESWL